MCITKREFLNGSPRPGIHIILAAAFLPTPAILAQDRQYEPRLKQPRSRSLFILYLADIAALHRENCATIYNYLIHQLRYMELGEKTLAAQSGIF